MSTTITWREAARERAKGAAWAQSLDSAALGDLEDALVLGDFDWRDWGFDKRPSAAFMNGADDERMRREIGE